ncbi:MAG: response regulator transcription factor [Candidatus Krumholzibacteria bacterium]|nr:response regulator transcription factor [Candidatus Krumholzibacteria bacterium]
MIDNIKLMLVDDHNIVRQGFKSILEDRGFEVIAEAADGKEAINAARDILPDVIIMDVGMPRMRGIEASRRIKKEFPSVKIIMLTIHTNETYIYESLDAGANGYLVKDTATEDLVEAIKAVVSGEIYISRNFPPDVLENYGKLKKAGKKGDQFSRLTNREREVLQYIAEGNTSQAIARELFISKKTVENHRANIMNKLGIHDTASLVMYAVKIGLVDST